MTDRNTLKARAREMRSHLTDAEQALWAQLRRRNIADVRFLRQRVIDNYILDFYAPSILLAIEVDGGQHWEARKRSHDAWRKAILNARGITVLRFSNLEVLQQQEAVLEEIERIVRRLQESGHPPAPAARPPSSRRG